MPSDQNLQNEYRVKFNNTSVRLATDTTGLLMSCFAILPDDYNSVFTRDDLRLFMQV